VTLSRRERSILAEIERALRSQNHALAAGFDRLGDARHRFSCHVSRREIVCLVGLMVVLEVLLVVLLLAG
jgi:hypothetical protein